MLFDQFKSYFVFPQFKQFQVQLPLHPKQLPQVTVYLKAFFFYHHVKLCHHNSLFFGVTKSVWVKDKEWIKSIKVWNLAKDCRITNSHNTDCLIYIKIEKFVCKVVTIPLLLSSNTNLYGYLNLVRCRAATQKIFMSKRLYLPQWKE